MPEYRRAYVQGGTFFFTVVTYRRQPIFQDEEAVSLLSKCFKAILASYPFKIDAFVILPDHLHTIWTLPDNDSDFSTRWKRIKSTFSRRYQGQIPEDISESMYWKKEKGVWQRRFWEHVIRDQEDFNRHCNYIHYNPVKHGLVKSPSEWKYSSFSRFVDKGLYSRDWGKSIPEETIKMEFD